jgi:hypothetical protein
MTSSRPNTADRDERPIDRVLAVLEGEGGPDGQGWYTRFCPAHDDKNTPNLRVKEDPDGRVGLFCNAGCSQDAVLDALEARGVPRSALFPAPSRNGRGGVGSHTTPTNTTYVNTLGAAGCTLDAYAEARRLPVGFLRSLGLDDHRDKRGRMVRIPYADEEGKELAVRFRLALEKPEDGSPDRRFRWRGGDKAALYGLWRLGEARESGRVILVEGESDCHTLWHHGLPAVGVPGATCWRNDWAAHLEGIERVYVVVEPDAAGESLWDRLTASPLRERLYRVDLHGYADPSEMHVADHERFRERLDAALGGAVSYMDLAETEAQERARSAWARCEGLALSGDILGEFADDLKRSGLAGSPRAGKLLYLGLTSRLLSAKLLVNVALKGPSSAGKSYTVEKVLDFFPETAYHSLTASSERALIYGEEPISHRFLILAEADGIGGDLATYLIRSLLSEGRIDYETVDKTADGMKPRRISREGPTGLIVTTTRTQLHRENETRLLSVPVDDSQAHTREILGLIAEEDAEAVDFGRWRALQTWLEGGDREVTVPFAKQLAALIPPLAVRLRRDFGQVLNLIRAHALLHRATRERDGRGRIAATVDDYAAVRGLVADLISEGAEATVKKTVRETADAVRVLNERGDGEGVSIKAVGKQLKLDYQPAHRRVTEAEEAGFVRRLEGGKGKSARLVPGDPLPEDRQILPEPSALQEGRDVFTYLRSSEGVDHPTPREAEPERGAGPVRVASVEEVFRMACEHNGWRGPDPEEDGFDEGFRF